MSIAPLDRHVIVLSGPQEFRDAGKLSELERCKYLVLLGEPGLGKTEALRFLASVSGTYVHSSSLFDMEIDGGGESIFVDGLDEVSLDGAAQIGLSFLRAKQAKWRVSCRVEAWSPEGRLGKIFGPERAAIDEEPVIALLQPLSSEEVPKVLCALGCANPELFVARLEALGSTPFINSPLGLKFLANLPEGHLQVSTRTDLYELGVRALAEEHNTIRAEDRGRLVTSKLLDLAGHICLVLLLCGKHGVKKRLGDGRTLSADELGVDFQELDSVLDTALFVRDGEIFTSMHRSVQEFLAARYLARAVTGCIDNAEVSFLRTLALFESVDGRAPSHLKSLYAWYAVHLECLSFTAEAMTLLQRDPECILFFGDSAKFSSNSRRRILMGMGARDPFFQTERVASQISLAGLVTEDIADVAGSILSDSSESPHRINIVLQAISDGSRIRELGGICRELVLKDINSYWCASQAIRAWVRCSEPPPDDVWALVAELSKMIAGGEDEYRYRLIVQAFMSLPINSLTVGDARRVIGVLDSSVSNVRPGIYALRDISWYIARSPIWRSLILDSPYDWFFSFGQGSVQHRLAAGVCIAALALEESVSVVDMANMLIATGCITGTKSPPSFEAAARTWLSRQVDHDEVSKVLWSVLEQGVPEHGSVASGFKAIGLKPSLDFCRWLLTSDELVERLGAEYVGSQAVIIYTYAYDVVSQDFVLLVEGLGSSPVISAAHLQIEQCVSDFIKLTENPRDEIEELIASLATEIRSSSVSLGEEKNKQVSYWAAALYCGDYWSPGAKSDNSGVASIKATFGEDVVDSVTAIIVENYKCEFLGESNELVAGMGLLLVEGDTVAMNAVSIGQLLRTYMATGVVRNPPRRKDVKLFCISRLSYYAETDPGALEEAVSKPYVVESLLRMSSAWDLPNSFNSWLVRRMLLRMDWVGKILLSDILALCSSNFSASECVETANSLMPVFVDAEPTMRLERDLLSLLFWAAQLDPDFFGPKLKSLLTRFSPETIHFIILDKYDDRRGEAETVFKISSLLMNYFVTCDGSESWCLGKYWPDVYKVLRTLVVSENAAVLETLIYIRGQSGGASWRNVLSHEIEKYRGVIRDKLARMLSSEDVLSILAARGAVNAFDLRALVVDELEKIAAEIQSSSLNDWRLYWDGRGTELIPKVENDCRDAVAVKLRERLRCYGSFTVDPESASSGYTRADLKVSYKDYSVPIEVKRTSHSHLWFGHTGQLQTYALGDAMEGQGIYLVFWFGSSLSITGGPSGTLVPESHLELRDALLDVLSAELSLTTSVVVFDVTNASESAKERKQKDFRVNREQRSAARGARSASLKE
ncbi:NACHT domain-containing protein [Pseudomonas psychrophila]|uniref:NACHT domain-containing protein n=1 Tax=Pseudomonas psychrophila TaxID=122355 RepID=UPI00381AA437